jgi:ABC-type branched-subunit amino acid transport system ATPase component
VASIGIAEAIHFITLNERWLTIDSAGIRLIPMPFAIRYVFFLFSSLTVLENLQMGATVIAGKGRSIEERLEGGRIKLQGEAKKLLETEEVINHYLAV